LEERLFNPFLFNHFPESFTSLPLSEKALNLDCAPSLGLMISFLYNLLWRLLLFNGLLTLFVCLRPMTTVLLINNHALALHSLFI